MKVVTSSEMQKIDRITIEELGMPGAPRFLNGVVRLLTALAPEDLLDPLFDRGHDPRRHLRIDDHQALLGLERRQITAPVHTHPIGQEHAVGEPFGVDEPGGSACCPGREQGQQ